jgi:8-oxo-dGTP diphosphatase
MRRTAESSHWPGQWDLPGGKLDAGETFEQALIREAKEETGLEIEITRFIGAAPYDLESIRLIFLLLDTRTIGGTFKLSGEHSEARWVSVEKLPVMDLIPPIARMMATGLSCDRTGISSQKRGCT